MAVPAKPTVAIGSTTGTGPGGCVKYSKLVGFSMSSNGGYNYFTGSRVYLDGKLVNTRVWYLPRLQGKGKAAQSLQTISFTSVIRLSGLSGGNHTLTLLGLTAVPILRLAAGGASSFDPATGRVTATKTIRKCTAFTG